jgi:hypothetical protein
MCIDELLALGKQALLFHSFELAQVCFNGASRRGCDEALMMWSIIGGVDFHNVLATENWPLTCTRRREIALDCFTNSPLPVALAWRAYFLGAEDPTRIVLAEKASESASPFSVYVLAVCLEQLPVADTCRVMALMQSAADSGDPNAACRIAIDLLGPDPYEWRLFAMDRGIVEKGLALHLFAAKMRVFDSLRSLSTRYHLDFVTSASTRLRCTGWYVSWF